MDNLFFVFIAGAVGATFQTPAGLRLVSFETGGAGLQPSTALRSYCPLLRPLLPACVDLTVLDALDDGLDLRPQLVGDLVLVVVEGR